VNYAKSKGLVVSIVTNGVKLKENAEEIVRNKWDMILFLSMGLKRYMINAGTFQRH
jgi:hypothetical protein